MNFLDQSAMYEYIVVIVPLSNLALTLNHELMRSPMFYYLKWDMLNCLFYTQLGPEQFYLDQKF